MGINNYPATSRALTELYWSYTAVGGETVLSGYDASSNFLQYNLNREKLYLNGVLLLRNTDYTATDGVTIQLVSALNAADVINIQANNNYQSQYISAASLQGQITAGQVDSTIATTTGAQTLTNKTISGASNTLANIPNSALSNSSIILGSTTVVLGSTNTTLTGLTLNGSLNTFINIPNSGLQNSSITINGTIIPLGGTATFTGISGTGLNGVTTSAITALGTSALQQNSTGTKNVAVGVSASLNNTNGTNNTAVGDSALYTNQGGTDNVAIGQNALNTGVSASGNTAVGSQAFKSNTNGSNNTVVGFSAGTTLQTGSNDIVIGYQAAPSSSSASNEITIGNGSITRLRIPGLGFDTNGVTSGYILSWNGSQLVWITPPVTTNIPNSSLLNSTITLGSTVLTLGSTTTTVAGLTTTAQILNNPSLNSPSFSTIVNTGTLTLPSSTDTLVGRNTTDTLNNKTLVLPIIASIQNGGTLTLPSGVNDTLLGLSTAASISNKNIDGSFNILKVRAQTATNWSGYGLLQSGEFGYEPDTGLIKIGTGYTAYGSLPYINISSVTNSQSASYTLFATDANKVVEINSSSAATLTVPTDAISFMPNSTRIELFQTGAGQITITPASGVTINAQPGLKTKAQWGHVTLLKRGVNTWVAYGDLSA
jgi:hypothetical protein